MNILITSISNKVPLIEAVRNLFRNRNIHCKVIGADSNDKCIARHFVDDFWQMSLLPELSIGDLIKFCQKNRVKVIFPTREGELTFFSKYKAELLKNGVHVMVSDLDALKLVQDKFAFYNHLKRNDFPVIETGLSIDSVKAKTYVVKERFGAGSRGLALDVSESKAREMAKTLSQPIFQPFIKGKEYSVDLYVDRFRNCKGVIVRERVVVIDGESQIARTIKHHEIEHLAKKLAKQLNLYGHAMFQMIVDDSGSIHIVECNPRFGGASTLSVRAGLESFYWFYLESCGKSLDDIPFKRSKNELTQVRYLKDLVF